MSRLELRPPSTDDLIRMDLWGTDPEIQALDPITGPVHNIMRWSIYVDDVHIGLASVHNIIGPVAELGIRIGLKEYWDKGYGTGVINQILSHCFTVLGYVQVHLKVLPANTRAIRCYKKVGFVECGEVSINGVKFIRMRIERR